MGLDRNKAPSVIPPLAAGILLAGIPLVILERVGVLPNEVRKSTENVLNSPANAPTPKPIQEEAESSK